MKSVVNKSGYPQLENGYTKIANEILDNLCRTRIRGEYRQMLDFIIRKTYGFNKKRDSISTTQIVEGTGLTKSSVHKARKWLKDMKIISIAQEGYTSFVTYSINKRYKEWRVYPKKGTVPQKGSRVYPIKDLGVPQKETTIITKETLQKKHKESKTYFHQSLKNTEIKSLFDDYLVMRKSMKKPMTNRAKDLFLNKLIKNDIGDAKQMLETAIEKNWLSVYPLKD